MEEQTESTETATTDPSAEGSSWWPVSHRARGRVLTVTYALLVAGTTLVGPAAAPPSGGGGGGGLGSEICGTAIATTVNKTVPLVMVVTIVGGLILGYLIHAYSGFVKDPQKVKDVKDWRNRAIITALSAPLLGKLLEIIIGFPGLGLAQCIDIVPGI